MPAMAGHPASPSVAGDAGVAAGVYRNALGMVELPDDDVLIFVHKGKLSLSHSKCTAVNHNHRIWIQAAGYVPGDERASEHTRNGTIHWWLMTNAKESSKRPAPTKEQLRCLIERTYRDPDKAMAWDVRSYIRNVKNCDQELLNTIMDFPKKRLARPN